MDKYLFLDMRLCLHKIQNPNMNHQLILMSRLL